MDKTIRLILLTILVNLFTGCAIDQPEALIKNAIGKSPQHGQQQRATVGEAIYSEFDYSEEVFAEPVESKEMRMQLVGKIKISPSTKLIGYKLGESTVFCSEEKTYYDPLFGPAGFSCFSDENNDGSFDHASVNTSSQAFLPNKEIGAIPYRIIKGEFAKGNKLELIYQGRFNGNIRILYREFIDNMIRPAFSQEVVYALNQEGSTEIAFKGVSINVINATNQFIDYIVKSGFVE